ncbi:hypothetical protein CGRA01v4_07353 [Colletotrichum graminicola]|nr:hypothetical protein CGRA01v4_07353 [Colletotrichum graminicola]
MDVGAPSPDPHGTLLPLGTTLYFLRSAIVAMHTVAAAENSSQGEDCSRIDGAVSGSPSYQGGYPICLFL